MITPGFVLANASLPMSPAVSGVFGRCTEMKSARASSSSSVSSSMPSWRGAGGRHVRVVGDDVRAECGEPLRRPAARCGPDPTTPTVLPKISVPENDDRFQVCSRSDASAGAIWRAAASISARACSAALWIFDVGALTTSTPRAVAASTSTLSRPTPAPGDDLEFGGGGQHLGVDGGRRAHQQRVGLGHRGQQLFAVGAVHPADLYLVTERGNGGFGQFVGNQYDGKTHPASLMGLNRAGGWT